MIGWGSILYGAGLSAVLAGLVTAFVRQERSARVLWASVAAGLLGPLVWNSMLHRAATDADAFFVDIPFRPFPVSWQDTGSGVFTLAVASLLLGLTLRREPAARVLGLAATVGAVAFLVDIYLY